MSYSFFTFLFKAFLSYLCLTWIIFLEISAAVLCIMMLHYYNRFWTFSYNCRDWTSNSILSDFCEEFVEKKFWNYLIRSVHAIKYETLQFLLQKMKAYDIILIAHPQILRSWLNTTTPKNLVYLFNYSCMQSCHKWALILATDNNIVALYLLYLSQCIRLPEKLFN